MFEPCHSLVLHTIITLRMNNARLFVRRKLAEREFKLCENITNPIPLIAFQNCPNCEVAGTEIIGSDVGPPIASVTLATECKRHCQSNTECEFYVWSAPTQECHLKSSDAETAVASGISLK